MADHEKIQSFVLYGIYIGLVLGRQALISYTQKTFSSSLIFGIYILIPVIYTLIILIHTHLAEPSCTIQDLLFNALFIVVSVVLIIWYGMVDIYLLYPIMTEDIYDIILRIARNKHK